MTPTDKHRERARNCMASIRRQGLNDVGATGAIAQALATVEAEALERAAQKCVNPIDAAAIRSMKPAQKVED